METENIFKAIHNLAPNAEFAFTGDDLKTLDWHNAEITRPSDAEIMAEAQRLADLPPKELTIDEKLASVGLSLNDLKTALGI